MKRKRNQNDESNNNVDKKLRYDEEHSNVNQSNEISDLDNSLIEKKEEFVLTREIAHNAILRDIAGKQWRIGAPVGKGSFGEIYLASNDISNAVNVYNANYVTKIEPHSNGPLFVEIHCLLNVNKQQDEIEEGEKDEEKSKNISLLESPITGIPKYIASGSHFFNDIRYRFLIMPRYKADLHSITKSARLSLKHFLIIASQIIDVLMHLHEKHYVHSDIKAQNIMIGQYHSSNYHHQQPLTNGYKKTSYASGNKALNSTIQYSGANPLRSCRMEKGAHDKTHHSVYNEMVQSHYLRPGRSVSYSAVDENSRSSHSRESESSDNSDDEDYELSARKKKSRRNANKSKRDRKNSKSPVKNAHGISNLSAPPVFESATNDTSDHVYIIDYGLATKFVDTNGEHRPFCMDQRRAHDGTLEFTSRDAHFGAHSRRSDLECFGYNLIYWSQGYLPWKDERLKEQPEIVHRLKEIFMTDVKEMLKLFYGKDVPKYLGEFMNYVGQLEFDEEPNYAYLKGLFEKEFLKMGYKKSDMILNLNEVREQCEPIDKSLSEHDLMMASITDLKTVTKLGFLVSSSDNIDGVEVLVKPNESMSLNLSCKASPKNLRSKEKSAKGKKPKRQRKLTEKEIISEKIAKGKKLSIQEIATLDPEQIARDRAEKEYEKFDEKVYYQTPQRYKGNPTYAILEIENRLRNKHNGSANVSIVTASTNATEIEPIKGYTKPMMDVLKKQQMIVEQQMVNGQGSPITTYQKRNREGLRNVIKSTQKNITYQNEVKKSNKKSPRKGSRRAKTIATIAVTTVKTKASRKIILDDEPETEIINAIEEEEETASKQSKGRKGRRRRTITTTMKTKRTVRTTIIQEEDESEESTEILQEENEQEEMQTVVRTRGRKRSIKDNRAITRVIESAAPETEEDSVYYDIPGEGSNDGTHEPSSDSEEQRSQVEANNEEDDDDNESDNQPLQKRLRKREFSGSEENSNDGSVSSVAANTRARGRYYNDEDFEAYTDEASNISSISHVTKSSLSFKPRRARGGNSHDSGINTRNKLKSRSTSRSAAATENSEEDEEEESEFEAESTDESDDQGLEFEQNLSEDEEENTDGEASQSSEIDDDDDDSIDIKYSPIKTRHARRRINCFNVKQIRGRRINELNESDRNFRLVSTRG
ncbi:hypothetical protein PVAND_011064 [Polypedilum vanderplanki]|uniref:non-specific serine/threonine protein kinase n=1 Tax=Polypedilum vanderplanki TaxID=319348 RepID=A0A9J6CHH7_POLVA|nr:hypothetical protein PVAND_011064 [Polypedilum vanderplanki]